MDTPWAERRRREIAVVAVGVAALVLASIVATLPAGAAMRAGRNYRLDAPPLPLRARDVPALAVDPDDPRHIVAVSQEYRFQRCDYHVSFDGGRTWRTGQLRGPEDFPSPLCPPLDEGGYSHFNATIVFGSGDNVYTAFSAPAPDGADSILVAKSTDGGRTFRRGVVAIRGIAFPPPPAVDPDVSYIQPTIGVVPRRARPDLVYIATWGKHPFNGGCSRRGIERGACNHIFSATSTDGGRTFTGPVQINAEDELAREQSQPVVASDGTVYVVYRGRMGPVEDEHTFLRLARSEDRGQTWELSTIAEEPVPLFPGLQPRLAIDRRAGILYVVHQGRPYEDGDVFLRRSTDGGATWSLPTRINDDAVGNGVYQSAPDVTVAPAGRVDVVWFDQRHAYPGAISVSSHSGASVPLEDVYFATSRNQGASFSRNVRVTDRTRNLDVGLRDESNFDPFWGAVTVPLGEDKALVAWADSRLGSVLDDNQDIFLAKVDLDARGPAPVRPLAMGGAVDASVDLSQLAYPGGSEDRENRPATKVVIVNRNDPAAALVASVLARFDAGPVLVARTGALPGRVAREVARLRPVAGAYLVGDEEALSDSVAGDLVDSGVPEDAITRIAGSGIADTARLVAAAMDTRDDVARAAGEPAFAAAVVVNPRSDVAATGAALAAALRLPVLVARANSIPAATEQALEDLAVAETFVIGGRDVIDGDVAAQLPGARRVRGDGAEAVSRAVVAESLTLGQPEITLPHNVVYVIGSGRRMLAALAGAAVARMGGAMLVVDGTSVAGARQALGSLGIARRVDRLVLVR